MIKRSTAKDLKKQIEFLYDTADVTVSYSYWFNKLLALTLTMFDYKGLPDSLPQREIEAQLQLTGHCVLFLKNGLLRTTNTGLYGFDAYYQPTNYVWAQPFMGSNQGKSLDDENCCIIYNDVLKDNIQGVPVEGGLYTFISHYARILADITSTTSIYLVNMRITSFPIAKNDSVRASIEKFFNAFTLGRREIINDKDIVLNAFDTAEIGSRRTPDTLMDLLQAKDKVLEQFYRDIGVKFRQQKKAQMNEEEVESDEQVLLISLDDMLKSRKEGIELLNEKMGFNVSVDINEKFKRDMQGATITDASSDKMEV